jgi:hypothetical protein
VQFFLTIHKLHTNEMHCIFTLYWKYSAFSLVKLWIVHLRIHKNWDLSSTSCLQSHSHTLLFHY